MNKSILKHEIKSMKWMALLSILGSIFLTILFSTYLDNSYQMMFYTGIKGNEALIHQNLGNLNGSILIIFTILSLIQIYMQFRSEKDQEVGRFLKSLPVKNEEFLKIKIITGLANISLAFIVLAIGIVMVRGANMFWIKDVYSISVLPERFIEADGIVTILKELGLIYLVVLSFYTFLFMIQYTFSNILGGIVTGFFVWLSPAFVLISSIFTIEKLSSAASIGRKFLTNGIDRFFEWLLPWTYAFQYKYSTTLIDINGVSLGQTKSIKYFKIKLIVLLAIISINIYLAYKLNKSSKVENENMIIPFKLSRTIFKVGVTICSALLIPIMFEGFLGLEMHKLVYAVFLLVGGVIGYIISGKITEVGTSKEV